MITGVVDLVPRPMRPSAVVPLTSILSSLPGTPRATAFGLSIAHAFGVGKAGFTLLEIIFVMTVAVVLAAVAVPQTLASVDRSRAWAAARYLAGRMALARMQAVGRSATVALRFADEEAGFRFDTFVDGNRNGVRAREITSGVDRPLDRLTRLSDLFPGVVIGLSEGEGGDPVRTGSSSLMSFTPLGTATSGTIYIRGRDGSRFAVRVLGATGRTRVLRYVVSTRDWSEVP